MVVVAVALMIMIVKGKEGFRIVRIFHLDALITGFALFVHAAACTHVFVLPSSSPAPAHLHLVDHGWLMGNNRYHQEETYQ